MDKIFLYNENNICINPNVPISWTGDDSAMGWNFRVYTALTPKGWTIGFDYNMGDECGSHGCRRCSNKVYGTQKEAIYNTLKYIEKVLMGKNKGKHRKEMLSEIRKGIDMYDIRQLELFN